MRAFPGSISHLIKMFLGGPAIGSCSSVGTVGGTGNISGTGFQTGMVAEVVELGVTLTLSSLTSTLVTYTLAAGAYAAGAYTLRITNVDRQWDSQSNIFNVLAIETPNTILGSDLIIFADSDHCTNTGNGTPVTAVTDQSGAGNNATTVNNITYTSSDASWDGKPSFSWSSASSSRIDFPISGASSGTGWTFITPVKVSSAGTDTRIVDCPNVSLYLPSTNGKPAVNSFSLTPTWASSIVGSSVYLIGSADTSGGTLTASISVNDNTSVSSTSSNTVGHTSPVTWGADYLHTGHFANMTSPCLIVARRSCTQSELDRLSKYINLKYFNVNPTFTRCFNALSGSSAAFGIRIFGTNFNNRMTVELFQPGTTTPILYSGSLTVTVRSSTVCEVSVPAASSGTYSGTADIRLTNPDGGQLTIADGLVFSTTKTADVIWGLSLCYWIRARDAVNTGDGTSATAFTDRALGFDPTTVTSLTYHAADTDANSKASIEGITNPVLTQPVLSSTWITTPTDAWVWGGVIKALLAAGTDQYYMQMNNGSYITILEHTLTKMETIAGAATAQFGTASTGAFKSYISKAVNQGSGNLKTAINVSNGTQVNSSSIVASLSAHSKFQIFGGSSRPCNGGKFTEIIAVSRDITPGEQSDWQSYCTTEYGV